MGYYQRAGQQKTQSPMSRLKDKRQILGIEDTAIEDVQQNGLGWNGHVLRRHIGNRTC